MNTEYIPNPLRLVQQTDFRTRIEREMRAAYVAAQAEGYYQGQPVFRIGTAVLFCTIDTQWQHPEHDGIVRTIKDRCGVVVVQSLTEDWPALVAKAKARIH